jgi:hypothetical protein
MRRPRVPARSTLSAVPIFGLLLISAMIVGGFATPGDAREFPPLACAECAELYYAWIAADRAYSEAQADDERDIEAESDLLAAVLSAEYDYNHCVMLSALGISTPDEGQDTGDVQAPDSDGDGVPDDVDACPGTALGAVVDAAGCPQQLQLVLLHTDICTPGELVVIKGVVNDANGNALSGAQLAIEVEGTDLSTSALSGTIEHEGWFDGFLPLPSDLPCGTYTVQVTASAGGYLDATDTMSICVDGAKMYIQFRTRNIYDDDTKIPANVPIGEKTEWRITVFDDKTRDEISDANLEITVTHLESGTSNRYSSLSTSQYPEGFSMPYYVWNFAWSEEHEGGWRIEVAASKDGYCPAHREASFTVGAHVVEIKSRQDAHDCWPNCQPTCSRNTVLIGHDTHGPTVCHVVGGCSLGHPVRYEWTAEAGSITHSSDSQATWIPPEVPGKYKITCRVICTEDPNVWKSVILWVEAMTREQFLREAEYGRIELHGFDRVRIESVDGDLTDIWGIEGEDDEEYEDLESQAGQWLAGDDWGIFTDVETRVTLGIYKEGQKVGEIQVAGEGFFRLKNLHDSTWRWYSPGNPNPYSMLINKRPAPPQYYKPIDWTVKTYNCSVGVRNTKYLVAFDPDTNTSIIGVLEGEVAVTPLLFDAPPQIIAGSQWITVDETEFGQLEVMNDEQVRELEDAFGETANTPPTASFTFVPEEPQAGDDIVVASMSSDPDDDLLTLSWYLNGEQLSEIGSQSDWEWENVEAGEYTLVLSVEDGEGGIDEHSAVVEVRASGQESANRAPSASFDLMPQDPTPKDTIVGVSTSSDPDDDSLTYSWYFDGEYDANIGNLPEWTWPNPPEGEYTIGLVVMDGRGGSDEYSMAVTVAGDDEDAGSDSGNMSNMLYFLLLLIPAAALVVVIGRRARRK